MEALREGHGILEVTYVHSEHLVIHITLVADGLERSLCLCTLAFVNGD